jgi:hypothetical protein
VRASKTVSGDTTQYVLDLAATLPVVISDTEAVYLYGLDILAQQQAERQYYFHDGLGTARLHPLDHGVLGLLAFLKKPVDPQRRDVQSMGFSLHDLLSQEQPAYRAVHEAVATEAVDAVEAL